MALHRNCYGTLWAWPLWTQPGDRVVVLKDSALPVVLQEEEGHWVYVGTCFILDLMSGEAAGRVRSSKSLIERVQIR